MHLVEQLECLLVQGRGPLDVTCLLPTLLQGTGTSGSAETHLKIMMSDNVLNFILGAESIRSSYISKASTVGGLTGQSLKNPG